MDHLKKRLEQFRVKVRAFFKYNWHNEPEGDQFRSLDKMLVVGAVRYNPTTIWRHICWNVYCVLSALSALIYILNAVDEIPGKFNLVKTTWHTAIVLAVGLCLVKNSILNQHFVSIQTARNFVNGKPFASGDSVIRTSNDSASRKKCFQRFQLTGVIFLAMVLIDHVIVNASVPAVSELLDTPRILQYLGQKVAKEIHFLFLLTVCPLWFNKHACMTATICSVLYAFNTEYEIYVRGFDNILDNVYSDVEEKLPNTVKAAPETKRFQRDQLYWQHLKLRVNDQVKLHVQFAENLLLLKPVVNKLFFLMYYNAMVYFSPLSYVVMVRGFSGASILLASGVALQLLECYMWCRIIDLFKDTNEKLELKIVELMTNIPHSQFHHKKYAEMRTTLCIMKTYVRNHEPFSCGGVFPISVESFTELLHIAYTVFTFLRDMGKKHLKTHRPMKRSRRH